jgi:hypothetical protein
VCRKMGLWSRLAGQVQRRDGRRRRARSQLDRRRWRTRCIVDVGNWARGEHGSAPTDLRSNLKRRRRARPGEHPARRSSAGSHGRECGTRPRHDRWRLGGVYDPAEGRRSVRQGRAGVEDGGRRCDDGTVQQRSADTARHKTACGQERSGGMRSATLAARCSSLWDLVRWSQ